MAELFICALFLASIVPVLWAADNLAIFADQDDDLDAIPRRARRRPPQRPRHPAPARMSSSHR